MNIITRYARINYVLFKNSLIRDSQIPGHIIASTLFRILELIISIVFFKVIFANVTTLAGWNYYQVLFLYAFARNELPRGRADGVSGYISNICSWISSGFLP